MKTLLTIEGNCAEQAPSQRSSNNVIMYMLYTETMYKEQRATTNAPSTPRHPRHS
jgi:hypothetical protein